MSIFDSISNVANQAESAAGDIFSKITSFFGGGGTPAAPKSPDIFSKYFETEGDRIAPKNIPITDTPTTRYDKAALDFATNPEKTANSTPAVADKNTPNTLDLFTKETPVRLPFQKPEDAQNMRGTLPATAANIVLRVPEVLDQFINEMRANFSPEGSVTPKVLGVGPEYSAKRLGENTDEMQSSIGRAQETFNNWESTNKSGNPLLTAAHALGAAATEGIRPVWDALLLSDAAKFGTDAILEATKSSPALGLKASSLRGLSPEEALQAVVDRGNEQMGNIIRDNTRVITTADGSRIGLTRSGVRQANQLMSEAQRMLEAAGQGTIPQLNKFGDFLDTMATRLNQNVGDLGTPLTTGVSREAPAESTLPGYVTQPGFKMGMSTEAVEPVGFGGKPQEPGPVDQGLEKFVGHNAPGTEISAKEVTPQVTHVDSLAAKTPDELNSHLLNIVDWATANGSKVVINPEAVSGVSLKQSADALRQAGFTTNHDDTIPGRLVFDPAQSPQPPTNPPTAIEPTGPEAVKERGFITTAKESPTTNPEVAAKISGNYNPLANQDLFKQAGDFVKNDPEGAMKLAKDESQPLTDLTNAITQHLIIQAQNAGKLDEAVNLVETLAKRGTSAGRAVQAFAAFNRLSPEGVLRYAQNQVEKFNASVRPSKRVKITDEVAKGLVDHAKKIDGMPDGEKKALETGMLQKKIMDLMPSSWAKKLSMAQTFAQLLNPKTTIRNIGGNLGFASTENISDVFGAALDSPLSLLTGKHSTSLPSLFAQMKGFRSGLQRGIKDALTGIDSYGVATQFDLPKTPVFKGKVGQSLERLLNIELRAPDRAFFTAAYDGSLYKQMTAAMKNGAKLSQPTESMKEIAIYDALYRTFQDDSVLSQAFTMLKRGLNLLSSPLFRTKEFGLGDFVLKYPRTPANILARGIDYSPVGFFKAAMELARPMVGHEFNQKKFVDNISRALVGSSLLVGTGMLLHRLGLITGKKEKDVDLAQLQREVGLGQYLINASGLYRFVMSGLDPSAAKLQEGDTQISYDWFQPNAILLSMGANIDDNKANGGLVSTIAESMANGIDTLADQPLIKNFTRYLKFGDMSTAAIKTAQDIPSSFVPTILSQIRQLVDNTQRNTYDRNAFTTSLNLAKNKIPGLAETLPPRVGSFGENLENYQNGSNNLFNVFFNPAFKSTYQLTPEAKSVLDLVDSTGEVKQLPHEVSNSQKINGQNMKLSVNQVTAFQRFVGTITKQLFHSFATDPGFQQLPDDKKVKYLTNVLSDIGSAGKIIVLGNRPKTISGRVGSILNLYKR